MNHHIGEVANVFISRQNEIYCSNNVIVLFDLSQPHLEIVIRSIDEYFASGAFVGFDFEIFRFCPDKKFFSDYDVIFHVSTSLKTSSSTK